MRSRGRRPPARPRWSTLLEQAGAKPYEDFKIDPAMLAKFAGTYKGADRQRVDHRRRGRALHHRPGGGAADAATHARRDRRESVQSDRRRPITVSFQVEGDKVTGFTLTQGPNPAAVYTRVEGK